MTSKEWQVSLHGGHSGQFCEHARDSLRDLLDSAVKKGLRVFGVTEHVPRHDRRFLYPSEVEKGWTVERLVEDFENYCRELTTLSTEFADRIELLRGFETEVVPAGDYVEKMLAYRRRRVFDYMVGSVHHVDEIQIDGTIPQFRKAVERFGGLEGLAVAYYRTVAEMVEAIRPEVVGHLDLVRRHAPEASELESPVVRRAAEETLEAVRAHGCILDVNTAGLRKGLGTPYPAPWLVGAARERGIGFCFGDDSHGVDEVGAGIEEARLYLKERGVRVLTVLRSFNGELERREVPLE